MYRVLSIYRRNPDKTAEYMYIPNHIALDYSVLPIEHLVLQCHSLQCMYWQVVSVRMCNSNSYMCTSGHIMWLVQSASQVNSLVVLQLRMQSRSKTTKSTCLGENCLSMHNFRLPNFSLSPSPSLQTSGDTIRMYVQMDNCKISA